MEKDYGSVWAVKHDGNSHANFKMTMGNKEVSVSCDDSCGATDHLGRSDIRCYVENVSVTGKVFGKKYETYPVWGSVVNLQKALRWLSK